MVPAIKERDDVDGCGCLECRGLDAVTIRRSVPDVLAWSVRLFWSHPSIVAFGVLVVAVNRLLETDLVSALPTPAVGVAEAAAGFAFVVLLRAYAAVLAAGELTDDPVTVRDGVRQTLARVPALTGTLALFVFLVLLAPSLLSVPLLLLVGVSSANLFEVAGVPVVAVVALVAVGGPMLLVAFKFWFAAEACVVGRYGPVESLRVSWRLTTNYRRRFLFAVVIAAASVVSLALPGSLLSGDAGLAPLRPVVTGLSASLGELLSLVWASAYAHLYVQGVVESPGGESERP